MDPNAKAQAALDSMKVDEICMNGKTLPVFTEKNLESMGKEQLKSRQSGTCDPGVVGWLESVGISKFRTARSRLYRSHNLQVNIRWHSSLESS